MTESRTQPSATEPGAPSPRRARQPSLGVRDPAELIRMAAVVGRLSSEIREMELDEQGTHRVAEVHARVVTALREALDEELMAELDQLAPGLGEATASETDVRVAQAQLTGWLDGLFQGFQLQVAAARPVAGHDPRGERPALPPDHEPGAGTYL